MLSHVAIGGLGIAMFCAWRLDDAVRRKGFLEGSSYGLRAYRGWLIVLKYLVPVAIIAVFLHSLGAF